MRRNASSLRDINQGIPLNHKLVNVELAITAMSLSRVCPLSATWCWRLVRRRREGLGLEAEEWESARSSAARQLFRALRWAGALWFGDGRLNLKIRHAIRPKADQPL